MKNINEHIKKNEFKKIYLLYGNENYLKKLYLNKLREAIVGDDLDMNYSHFEGKATWLKDMIGIALTMPFFAEKRLVVVENSNIFKEQSDFSNVVLNIPESTIIIFVEDEVDKRSKAYKSIKDIGYVCEMNYLNPIELKQFVVSLLKKENKYISDYDASLIVELVGNDMMLIASEIEKLVSFAIDKDEVTIKDFEQIGTTTINSHIFKMIDFLALKKQKEAIRLYNELLKLKQAPLSILYNINKHFSNLYLISSMYNEHKSEADIVAKTGVFPWKMRDYNAQLRNLGPKRLKQALEYGVNLEEKIKTGQIDEKIALELMIITLSS